MDLIEPPNADALVPVIQPLAFDVVLIARSNLCREKVLPLAVVSERLGYAHPGLTLSIYTHSLKADELAAARVWEGGYG